MAEGGYLYLDATDQKGPVIFFINFISVILGKNNYIGLWILEVLAYILFLIPLYKISQLLKLKNILFIFVITCITFSLPFLLDASGNAVEFWSLPFMAYSLYVFCLYYLKDNSIKYFRFFVVGFCFSISMLLRFNQIGIWIGFAIVVLVNFLIRKQYLSLIKLMFSFLLGLLFGIIPFLIYHFYTNSIYEFINQSLLLNLSYVKTVYISSTLQVLKTFLKVFIKNNFFVVFILYFIVLVFMYKNKKLKQKELHISIILSIFIDIYNITFNSRLYTHYFILLYPVTAFCFMFAVKYIFDYARNKKIFIGLLTFLVTINFIPFAKRIIIQDLTFINFKFGKYDISKSREKYFSTKREYRIIGDYIKNNTEKEDKIYSQRPEVYLTSERFSNTRYFSLPYFYIEKESPVFKEFFSDFEKNKPLFLVMNKKSHRYNIFKNVREKMNDYINTYYIEMFRTENMIVYKLNN